MRRPIAQTPFGQKTKTKTNKCATYAYPYRSALLFVFGTFLIETDVRRFFPQKKQNNKQLVQDTHQELMQSLSITSFPTFRFYLEGAQVDETRGANIDEIAQKVRKLLIKK